MTQQYSNIGNREIQVMHLVQQGYDDFQKIREQLTLSWRQLDYTLEKLEDVNLVTIQERSGYTTREVDGQRRKFKAPRGVKLTTEAEEYLNHVEVQRQYQDLTREELVEQLHRLEKRVSELEAGFKTFKKQIRSQIN